MHRATHFGRPNNTCVQESKTSEAEGHGKAGNTPQVSCQLCLRTSHARLDPRTLRQLIWCYTRFEVAISRQRATMDAPAFPGFPI